jgi:hypothetical protein
MSRRHFRNQRKKPKIKIPPNPEIMSTHWKAPVTSKKGISKFIPNIPAITPKMATTNVAVVRSSSNCIS